MRTRSSLQLIRLILHINSKGFALLQKEVSHLQDPTVSRCSIMSNMTHLIVGDLSTNGSLHSSASQVDPPEARRVSMSPSPGDVLQTPEPKSSGLANVFKSLTGNKSKHPQSPASTALHINAVNTLKHAAYEGPPNYQHLHQQLRAENPLADRLAAAASLRHAVQDYPLSEVTSIFKEGKDLIEATKPVEARIAGFELLTACVKHSSSSDPERLAYFRVLTAPADPDDFHLQLAALVELAKNGRDLSGFHYNAIPLLSTWLRQAFTTAAAARKHAGRLRTQKGKIILGEDTNLELLFAFIVDVIKFSFNVANGESTGDLIDIVLYICLQTASSHDLRACICVIDAIITYGDIPSDKLSECVKVLCSIHCLVDEVEPEAWRSISNLAKSHNGQTTVRILLDILRNPKIDAVNKGQTIREIRGALSVLEKLFAKDGEDGYPLVPFTLLMEALTYVVTVDHAKVDTEILKLILSLFDGENDEVMQNVMEEDWSIMFEVVLKCSQRALETSDGRQLTNRPQVASPPTKEQISEQNFATNMAQLLYNLIIRIEGLLVGSPSGEFLQRGECIVFFVGVHPHLPESCARLVIDYYTECRCCYPSDLDWQKNIKTILGAFFTNRSQPKHIRLHALKAVTDVFEFVEVLDQHEDPDCIQTFVTSIIEDVGDEKDIAVLQEVIAFAVAVAETAEESLFNYVIGSIRGSIANDRLQSPLVSPPASRHGGMIGQNRPTSSTVPPHTVQTPSNVVTRALVQIFMRTMDKSASKSLRIFEELLWIAKSHECETDARLSALKMLFRMRADWANRIFLISFTESEGLAASLYRTTPSLARKQAIDEAAQQNRPLRADDPNPATLNRSTSVTQIHAQGRQPIRSGSGVNRTLQRNHQMWMSPDPDALPELPSSKPSLIISSFNGPENENIGAYIPLTRTALDIDKYLDTIRRTSSKWL